MAQNMSLGDVEVDGRRREFEILWRLAVLLGWPVCVGRRFLRQMGAIDAREPFAVGSGRQSRG